MEGNQLDELDRNAGAYYKGNSTVLEGDAEDTQTLAKVVFGVIVVLWLLAIWLQTRFEATYLSGRRKRRRNLIEQGVITKSVLGRINQKLAIGSVANNWVGNTVSQNSHPNISETSDLSLNDDSRLVEDDVDLVCAICLDGYKTGEQICWSKNVECDHVFHLACIEPWLMKHNQCPCCRNNYLTSEGGDIELGVLPGMEETITDHQ